jgi:aryl-alcohol dehydrogenase-like predicted oxidoreductase
MTRSAIGLGTYLGDDDDPTDELYYEALGRALERGINVIDTAINYRSQRSERVIGRALRAAFARGVARGEVVVSTKGGFVPFDGRRPRNFAAYVQESYFAPGILARGELVAGCHAMTPRYLADQLERSRRNLGLEYIDIYYLHNPEMQLEEVEREPFLGRVRAAFELLEGAVRDGKIGVYGTATWSGYRQPEGAPGHLSLAELLAVAREVAGEAHHFRALQLPYNLAMPEAFTVENQRVGGRSASLLAAAAEAGMSVMTSASILQGKLARNFPAPLRAPLGLRTDAQRALQLVRSTPGVSTALVGMKRAAHVDELAEVLAAPPISPDLIRELLI